MVLETYAKRKGSRWVLNNKANSGISKPGAATTEFPLYEGNANDLTWLDT